MIDLKRLGKACQRFRQKQGISQSTVANETGYSVENVSAFECGKNDNSKIFLWYLYHGLDTVEIIREGCGLYDD